jgi:hypothetical protein
MIRQLLLKWQASEPLSIAQARYTIQVNSDPNWKINQLIQLQNQYAEQSKSSPALKHHHLKAISNELAHLKSQVKDIKYVDIILDNCDQCLGKSLKLCEKCILYIGGQIEKAPNHHNNLEKDNRCISTHDEGQEDAYWL